MAFQQDYDYLFKILLIGNSAVGKVLFPHSSLLELPPSPILRSDLL